MSANSWLILQLADSAFPTGGFAHSAGLEAGVHLGEVDSSDALVRFVDDALWQAGSLGLPFVRAAHADPESLPMLDARCDVLLAGHVPNRASRTQGRALLDTAARIFGEPVLQVQSVVRTHDLAAHHAPTFGAVLRAVDVDLEQSQRLFLHLALRGVSSAAVRLGVIGPHEAQRIAHGAAATLEKVMRVCSGRAIDEAAQTSPLVEAMQGAQDRLYSRLFQS
jgi:urease accessory protein